MREHAVATYAAYRAAMRKHAGVTINAHIRSYRAAMREHAGATINAYSRKRRPLTGT